MNSDNLREDITVVANPDELAHTAAELFRDSAQQAIAARGIFSAALSGGATPGRLFRRLGTSYRKKIAWDKVHLFWSDERCVPRDHEQSNFRLAYDELLSCIWIPYENVHRKHHLASGQGCSHRTEYGRQMSRLIFSFAPVQMPEQYP